MQPFGCYLVISWHIFCFFSFWRLLSHCHVRNFDFFLGLSGWKRLGCCEFYRSLDSLRSSKFVFIPVQLFRILSTVSLCAKKKKKKTRLRKAMIYRDRTSWCSVSFFLRSRSSLSLSLLCVSIFVCLLVSVMRFYLCLSPCLCYAFLSLSVSLSLLCLSIFVCLLVALTLSFCPCLFL